MIKKYLKPFLVVLGSNVFVKAVGMVKELLLGWAFGATKLLDSFLFIISIPNLVSSSWNKAIETVLLTQFISVKSEEGEDRARELLSQNVQLLFMCTTILYFLLLLLTKYIFQNWFNYFFSSNAVLAVKIVSVVIIVDTVVVVLKVFNYAQKKFFLPSVLPVFQSVLTVIALIIFWDRLTLLDLSLLFLSGSALQLLLLSPYKWFWVTWRTFHLSLFPQLKGPLKSIGYLSVATGLSAINIFVDKLFAVNISEGSVTYIHYGTFFFRFFQILFIYNINTIFFPQFQEYVSRKQTAELIADSRKVVKFILLITMAVLMVIINNGYFMLKVVLGHGKLAHPQTIQVIYQCLLGYSGVFLGMALNAILVRILHVYNETKLIFYVSMLGCTLNVFFNFLFVKLFGIWGIPLSTSVTILLLCVVYLIFLQTRRNMLIVNLRDSWYGRFAAAFLFIAVAEAAIVQLRPSSYQSSLIINVIFLVLSVMVYLLFTGLFKILSYRKLRSVFHDLYTQTIR